MQKIPRYQFFRKRSKSRYLFFLIVGLTGCSAQPVAHILEAEEETVTVENLHYYLYFPEDYDTDTTRQFPILLFLHGGGESGDRPDALKSNGPPKLIAEGKQFPFLILAPQNPDKMKWWNTRAVIQLLDTVVSRYRVDKKRMYLTGLSRGGNAVWELAVQYPGKFAAMAVVCGMTPVPYASWIDKEMPIWVFHGTADVAIPFWESEEMVRKLRTMGYKVQFTAYQGLGHNVWEKAYATEALYEWLIRQRRK